MLYVYIGSYQLHWLELQYIEVHILCMVGCSPTQLSHVSRRCEQTLCTLVLTPCRPSWVHLLFIVQGHPNRSCSASYSARVVLKDDSCAWRQLSTICSSWAESQHAQSFPVLSLPCGCPAPNGHMNRLLIRRLRKQEIVEWRIRKTYKCSYVSHPVDATNFVHNDGTT